MRSTGLWIVGGASLLVSGFWGCGDSSDTGASGAGGATAASSSVQVASASVVGPSSTASGMAASKLGEVCDKDGDCGAGMRCITPESNSPILGGGAVNGYCTKDCSKDDECPGEGSSCIVPPNSNTGECFLGCTIGPELEFIDDMLDPGKCHGRDDLRCSELSMATVCLPVCSKDEQCGSRQCDTRTGYCVDKASTGKPLGALCNPDAKVPECAGFCQKFTGTTPAICSAPCVLGDNDFFNTNDCGGLDKGLCVYRPSGYGAGDFGRCASACTSHDQCGNPAWWCSANNFAENGYCFTTEDCTTTADCANAMLGPEYACVPTKFGGKCLEIDAECLKKENDPAKCTLFPLGTAAPDPTGGSGGGGGAGGSASGAGGSASGAGGAGGAGGGT